MDASVKWLNDHIDPPLTAQEQAEVLTRHAFPVEQVEDVDAGGGERDTKIVVEVTSNRGDCLSHVGLAREIAAATGRTLRPPHASNRASGPGASKAIRVINHEPGRCPIYTARIMRGVTVKPSPEWMQQRLRAIGQIPRNNIVDATNFVLFELGQPTHVFDLAKIKGGEINIRLARAGERFLPIGEGEKELELTADDLVIADAKDAVAIGGVKGGALSAVTGATRDILIEAATFDPVTVRNSSRRHRIQSASAYRFERGVHPGFVDEAAERLVQLLLDLTGGELAEGAVAHGAPIPKPRQVTMRAERCARLLGIDISEKRMLQALDALGFQPLAEEGIITCTIPPHRLDVEREIDLVEEVSRLNGYDSISVAGSIAIRVAPPQARVAAKRAVAEALVGMGYLEMVTHSLVTEAAAQPFLQSGESAARIAEARAGAEPMLRPSILPSMLRVRTFNEDQGVSNLALFEIASTFVQRDSRLREQQRLALARDVTDAAEGLRPLRGAVERLAELCAGDREELSIEPGGDRLWLEPHAQATILQAGTPIGWMGMISAATRRQFGIEAQIAAAEMDLEPLLSRYPPQREVKIMPAFPAIERDISAIVEERVQWKQVKEVVESLSLEMLEEVTFITAYRGKQIGDGRKSLTLRLRFRAADRTLTHEEVDPQTEAAMKALERELGATIRK